MPVKLIHKNYLEIIGKVPVLLTGLLDSKQFGDLYAGRIVEEAALLSKAHAIVPKESGGNWDANMLEQVAIEIEAGIRRLIEDWRIKCVIGLGGKDKRGVEIRGPATSLRGGIGTDIVKGILSRDLELQIGENNSSDGTILGDAKTICILLGSEERGFRRELTVARIADLVGVISAKLGSETDQGPSDVLD